MGIRITMGCSTKNCGGRLVFTPESRRSSTSAPMSTCPECGQVFGLLAGEVMPLTPADTRIPAHTA